MREITMVESLRLKGQNDEANEIERLRTALDGFWRLAVMIEGAVKQTYGVDSPNHRDVVAAIRKATSYYKSKINPLDIFTDEQKAKHRAQSALYDETMKTP